MALYLLNEAGYEAFLVGGAVRDLILKKQVKDYDITTNATPNEIKEVFSSYKTFDIGKKYGTTLVIIDDLPIEITPYRLEEDYLDHRHPNKVTYTYSLIDDISRRDFTINSICMDYEGNIIDYYNGKKDLESYTLRCIGDPNKRFHEDALRILRAIRISCQYNLGIEKETRRALFDNVNLLDYVSPERKRDELFKILECNNIKYTIKNYNEIFMNFIPFIKNNDKLDNFKDPYYKLAYLLRKKDYDLKELKLSKDEINLINDLLKAQNIKINNDHSFITLLSEAKYPDDVLNFLKQLHKKTFLFRYMRLKNNIVNKDNLQIDGNELMALGFKNKEIKMIQNELIEKIRRNELENNKRAIKKYLKER